MLNRPSLLKQTSQTGKKPWWIGWYVGAKKWAAADRKKSRLQVGKTYWILVVMYLVPNEQTGKSHGLAIWEYQTSRPLLACLWKWVKWHLFLNRTECEGRPLPSFKKCVIIIISGSKEGRRYRAKAAYGWGKRDKADEEKRVRRRPLGRNMNSKQKYNS